MNKWEMPTGEYWEKWFINAYRTLKHGGWLIMYGMDRQTLLFKYYASLAGFDEQQSLYWYFISNFPKATDLSKMIEKTLGVEPIGTKELSGGITGGSKTGATEKGWNNINNWFEMPEPQTKLGKKYDGYKYSVAPLKQTCETIMVFKKPNKTGSVLHDTLAMENGDNTISVSALNIDDNRVGTEVRTQFSGKASNSNVYLEYPQENAHWEQVAGRYPAQSFVDEQVASRLDLQSQNASVEEQGCSKILHKIKYEQYDHDLFIYEPKVGENERNNGLDNFENKLSANLPMRSATIDSDSIANDGSKTHRTTTTKNNHPTLKPIDLNAKILKLFKTPNDQKICYPFAGSGSEIIGGLKAGFSNWVACEINAEYIKIANARIKHYTTNEYVEVPLFEL
jgi:hypothetical protein